MHRFQTIYSQKSKVRHLGSRLVHSTAAIIFLLACGCTSTPDATTVVAELSPSESSLFETCGKLYPKRQEILFYAELHPQGGSGSYSFLLHVQRLDLTTIQLIGFGDAGGSFFDARIQKETVTWTYNESPVANELIERIVLRPLHEVLSPPNGAGIQMGTEKSRLVFSLDGQLGRETWTCQGKDHLLQKFSAGTDLTLIVYYGSDRSMREPSSLEVRQGDSRLTLTIASEQAASRQP